jgi:hypothetical protein
MIGNADASPNVGKPRDGTTPRSCTSDITNGAHGGLWPRPYFSLRCRVKVPPRSPTTSAAGVRIERVEVQIFLGAIPITTLDSGTGAASVLSQLHQDHI